MSFYCYNHLDQEERGGGFTLFVFLIFCYCKCSVALSHGGVDWSAVCDFSIS